MKQAVVLAGGLGTRLRPITEKIPKALVEVNGRPFLYWQLEYLKGEGFDRVFLLCSHLGEQIEQRFGAGDERIKIKYNFEVPEPLGTGGALKAALPKLEEEFFLFNGDSYLEADTQSMKEFYRKSSYYVVMTAYRDLETTVVPANLLVDSNTGIGGTVNKYQKGGGRENGFTAVDSGVYIVNRSILEKVPVGKFQLEDLWPHLIETKKLGAYFEEQKFYDIGTPERIKTFEDYLK